MNQFHGIYFGPNSIFCNFKNGQKSIFELGKSLKLPEMQFHEEKKWFVWFHEFFCWTFLNFLARCARQMRESGRYLQQGGSVQNSHSDKDFHHSDILTRYNKNVSIFVSVIRPVACRTVSNSKSWSLVANQLEK